MRRGGEKAWCDRRPTSSTRGGALAVGPDSWISQLSLGKWINSFAPQLLHLHSVDHETTYLTEL